MIENDIILKISFAILVFLIGVCIALASEKKELKKANCRFEDYEFEGYAVIWLHAVILAFLYVVANAIFPNLGNGVISIIFYMRCLYLIYKYENEEKVGYADEWNGLKGIMIFLSATLYSVGFIVIYIVVILFQFFVIKRNEENIGNNYETVIIAKRGIDVVENVILCVLLTNLPMDGFVNNVFWNLILISTFTFVLPVVNLKFGHKIEKLCNQR